MKYAQLVKAIDTASQQLLGRAAAAVNQSLVIRNWLIGAYIVEFEQSGEDKAMYGARLLETLAADLTMRLGKGFVTRMLERMRGLYLAYPQVLEAIPTSVMSKLTAGVPHFPTSPMSESTRCALAARGRTPASVISGEGQFPAALAKRRSSIPAAAVAPLSPNAVLRLSWTQLIELIRLDDPLKRAFYENECLKSNWSVRQLQRQIGSLLYERTGLSRNKKAVTARAHRQQPQQVIEDIIRDPHVLEFTGLADRAEYHESDLEKALLDDLQAFLLELGAGFCFEARQFRVTVGNDHDYVDLVFYHRLLRCHVLLDLKVRAFRQSDAGQMNYYVNYDIKYRLGRDAEGGS